MRPRKILIVDAYSPAHVGNGVLLISSLNVIKRAYPDCQIDVLTLYQGGEKLVAGCKFYPFLFKFPANQGRFKKIFWVIANALFVLFHIFNQKTVKVKPGLLALSSYRKEALNRIEDADVVVSITGEAINDNTRRTLPFFLFTYWFAQERGKKMVVFPQSIGPLRRWWTRKMVAAVLPRLTLVAGRDQFSMAELRDLGIPEEKMVYSPDVGVIQPYISEHSARRSLSALGIKSSKKYLIGVAVSIVIEEGIGRSDYIGVLNRALLKAFKRDECEILLLPANMPVNEMDQGDYEVCMGFYKELESDFDVYILEKRVYPPDEFKGILALLDLFISTRMHVSILSTMALTPTITINTQRKLLGYMKNIGQEEFSLSVSGLGEDILMKKIAAALTQASSIKNQLEASRAKLVEQIDEFSKIFSTICG